MELDNNLAMSLLRRIADGDERAFARLYKSVSLRIYAFALQSLRDHVMAGEVVSETLYQVWRSPMAFRGEARFLTWLLGIARHKVLDRFRAQGPTHEDIDEYEDKLSGTWVDGFEVVSLRERQEGVTACLEKLAGVHRECLYLVYYEDLSMPEISTLLAVPHNTIKTRLLHARAKLKKCLQMLLLREGGHERA